MEFAVEQQRLTVSLDTPLQRCESKLIDQQLIFLVLGRNLSPNPFEALPQSNFVKQSSFLAQSSRTGRRSWTVLTKNRLDCPDLGILSIKDQTLPSESVEKVVGWALSHHLMNCAEPTVKDNKLVISADRRISTRK
ncbi:Uncharacterized protein Rs2_27108 [Raphanus sativus]|nr:Uncharacterized protein Rs2_27108 [Raphanus sativus]